MTIIATEPVQSTDLPDETPTTMLDEALALAAEGFEVFPIWHCVDGICACRKAETCDKPAKHPRCYEGHTRATTDEEQIRMWWNGGIEPHAGLGWECSEFSNIGVRVPDDAIVADIDPRNGGLETAADIEDTLGFPETRTAESGSGGWHLYYRVPAGLAYPASLNHIGPGIDIKQRSGYVLAPPSVHRSGGRYQWLDRREVADAPAWLLELTTGKRHARAKRKIDLNKVLDPLTQSQLADGEALIALLEPHYVEGSRHAIARSFGGYCKKSGRSEALAEYVVSQLPSTDPEARVEAALTYYSYDRPKGWDELKEHLPAAVLAALEGIIKGKRKQAGAQFGKGAKAKTKKQDPANDTERDAENSEESSEGEEQSDDGEAVSTEATDKEGKKIKGTIKNVANILAGDKYWRGVLAYNEFACRVLARKEPPVRDGDKPNGSCIGAWTDAHTARSRAWISEVYDFEPGKEAADSAVEMVARTNTFHPVREFLQPLVWDCKPRLDAMLASYFGVMSTPYASLVGSKFMISAVARVMAPGCKVDTMLILEGPQGTGKSTAVRVLAGDEWFADTALDFDNKDAAQCLQGKWIYEFGELHSFNRSEVTRIKAFVSSTSDNLRPSYGKRNEDFPRQCVFIGTTNDESYLTDTTGNRRYWPVRCGAIDVAALRRDREQLWAEARTRYESGERWWLDGHEEKLAAAEQSARESEDPWEAPIAAWAAKRKEAFTMTDVLKGPCALKADAQTQGHATRAGRLLSKLGYKTKRVRLGDGRAVEHTWARVYVPRAT
jgi:predicted P-loop ATPase